MRDSAKIVNPEMQKYDKIQYDKKHKKPTKYKKGDLVLVRILQHKPELIKSCSQNIRVPIRSKLY